MVYPNVSQKNYNYKILSNTSDTLTVQGPINLSKVTVGNLFAIVYGNLINDAIDLSKIIITPAKSGTKTTRFFNTTGTSSFADGDTTYDGVCEVCHTQTTHFKNDGTGSDQLHMNMMSPAGTNCTNCHMHVNGFRGMGGGVHSTHVTDNKGPRLACADCHGSNVPPMLADGQNLANTTVCNTCHSASGAIVAKTYWQTNPGNWTTVGGEAEYCGGCHDETPGNSKNDGTGDTAGNIVGDNTTYGFFVTGHGKTAGTYTKLSWQSSLAYGNPAANKACSACHDLSTPHYGSVNKRLKPGYENDSGNSNCKQCHDPGVAATSDPEWYTTYSEYQNSAHKNKKCTECHDVHGASGNYPGMTKANQESLCYQCHTQGTVQNNAMSGAGLADDIQQAFSLSYKHDLGTSFSLNFESYTLECVSCHNVHIITGKYWDASSGKSPVTRFTDNTSVWGDDAGEKMDDYVGSGIYQTPYADVFPGYLLPDYPTFCLDCHSSFGGGGQGGIDWGSDKHGLSTASNPGGNQGPYPDYWGIWAQGQIYDANPPAFKTPAGRGFVSFTYRPWDQERRIAGGNYVLSCTDCHEAHGANNGSITRTIIRPGTNEPGAESPSTDPTYAPPTSCQICHGVKTQEHNGGLFGCGSASCHQTADIHRIAHAGSGGGTTVFDREHVADIRFEGSIDDSGTWKMHGRWVDNGDLQSTNSSLSPNPAYLAKFVPGKSGQGFDFDGDDVVELGSRGAFSAGYAQSSATTGMARAFELTDTGTIQTWIYPTDLTGTKTIASNAKENVKNYALMIKDTVPGETGPRLVFHADTMDMYESDHGAYSSVTIPLNTWTHVAAVYNRWDEDHKIIRLYVNGTDVTANTGTEEYSQPVRQAQIEPASWWATWNMQPFLLGGHPDNFDMFQGTTCAMTDYFQGKMDEFHVYNVAKNPSQIRLSIGPALVSAKGKIGSDQLTIAFSRGVYTDTGASGALTPSDFILTDTDDSRTISSVSHSAGSSTATLTLSSVIDSSDDLFVDKLKVASNTVFDSGDNPAISLDVVVAAISNIKGAIAKDTSGISGIQTGDKVIIKFDIATQGTSVTSGNIDSALGLSNSHSWLSGSGAIISAAWSTTTYANDTLTITLSANGGAPSVAPGDIITLNGILKDASGVSIDDNHVISGTFGPLPDGAVGYWNMIENYGDVAYDSTDYENHGALVNLPSWTTGAYDSGLYFDGDDDYVEVPDSASLDLRREGTLEVWAKKDENRAYQVLIGKYATSGSALANYGYALADAEGKIAVRWGSSEDALITDCSKVPTGTWNHILATYDGSQIKVFLNGRLLKTGTYMQAAVPTAYPLRIGAKGAGDAYDSLFKGSIDEAVVYNRSLTNDEARERYGAPVKPNGALAYDTVGQDGIQAGDKVIIKFDGPTNGAAITPANIGTVFSLNNGHIWGTIQSAVWSTNVFTNDTLTVTLGTNGAAPTIDSKDIITADGSVLKDGQGNAINETIGVSGKFGPLPNGAVAYYDFNEGNGSVVHDASLNQNDGVIYGGSSWITGRTGGGNALELNGTDAYVSIDECGSALDLTTTGTLEFWMRKDTSPSNTYPVIVSKGQPGGSDGTGRYAPDDLAYRFYSSSNEERLTLYWGGSGGANTGNSNSYLNVNGGWKHVVVTYDGDARFYIDGEYVGGARVGTTGLATNEPVILGASAYFDSINYFLDGAIDEAIIYNRKLSPEEVRENSGIPWQMKTAVAYDLGGADGIQTGDRVVITFNGPTQATQITSANIDTALALPIGRTWKSGSGAIGNAVWSTNTFANDTLTIILSDTGGAPNVAVGNAITLDGATIKDHMGRPIPAGSVILAGTFNALSGDIVGYWNFAEGSGAIASDSSSFANHGTLQGDAAWTSGQDDGAVRFDASNAYVRVNDSNSLDLVTRDIYGVRIATRTTGWAVGQSGGMFQLLPDAYGNGDWSWGYYSPTYNHLYSVDMATTTDFFAVGASGTILRNSDGTSSGWWSMTSPVTTDLHAVDMLSSTSGWAVGKNNTILRFNGAAWSQQSISSPTATWTLKSVRMLSASEGWAAGGDNIATGVILRWNGSTWTEFATTTLTNMLTSIDMLDSSNGWTVGLGGKILRFDGASWTQFTSPVPYDLHAVKAFSASEAWAVGANRTILMFDGTSWTVNSYINQVSGVPTLRAIDSIPADPSDDTGYFDYTKFDYVGGDANTLLDHSDGVYLSGGYAGQRKLSWTGLDLDIQEGATFEIWAKKNSNKNDQTYLAKQTPNAQTIGPISYRIKEDGSSGMPAFTWNNYANTPGQLICSSAAPIDQWNHIAVTVNSGYQKIYLNGQLCATKTTGKVGLVSEYPLMFGTGYYGSADLDGDVDQITIYNRALSGDEVWSKYTSTTGSTAVTFQNAVADDNSGGGAGIHDDDRVTIMFNGPTAATPVSSANINTVLNVAGKTWLAGDGSVTAAWSTSTYTNDTLTITFSTTGGAPTVAVGDSINLSGGLNDSLGQPMTGSIAISGSFGNDILSWILDDSGDWKSGALAMTMPFDESVTLSEWDAVTYDIRSVDMLSATEGWAVGERGAIRKYDGTSWTAFASPLPYSGGNLNSVDMLSSTLGWAVGDNGKIIKFNGTTWSEETSPVTTALYGVKMISPTEGWAVGYSGKILRYDGTSWTSVTSPTTYELDAIDAVSSTEVWAGGTMGNQMLKWDGSSWNIVTLPASPWIKSIHMLSSTDGWLVGMSGKIMYYDGTSWSTVTSPTTRDLYSVRMVSATEGYAVGGNNSSTPGIILKWDGSTWSAVVTINSPDLPYYFSAVAMASAADGWAAGKDGVIYRWNGSAWAEFASVFNQYIWDIQFTSDTNGFAVGGSANMLRFDGSNWTNIARPPTTKAFWGLDAVSSNEVWVTGPNDYLWRYLNGSWTSFANPAAVWMYDVDMISSTDGWAVGSSGKIVRWNGASWSSVTSPTTNSITAIEMLSATDGWAVGGGGTILKWDGANWTTVASPTTAGLWSINMISSTEGWAVGYDVVSPNYGIMLKYDGTSWTQVSIPIAAKGLQGIKMRSSSEGMAVGYYGSVLTYDGTSWKYTETPPQASDSYSNYKVAYTPSGTPWVAGYAKLVRRTGYFPYGNVTHTFDAGFTVDWLSHTYDATTPAGTSVSFRWATSNDNTTWSAWTTNFNALTNSRYIRQEAGLTTNNSTITPLLNRTTIQYHPDLIAGAIAYWFFDEGAGTMVRDATGHSNTIDYTTNAASERPSWITGQQVNALYFDGTDDRGYVSYNTSQNLGTGDFTVETWLKFPSQVDGDTGGIGGAPISQRFSTSTGYEVTAGYPTSGKIRFKVNTDYVDTASDNLNDDVWRYFVFMREGTALKVYVNGVLDNTATATAGANVNTSRGISIGYARVWPDDYYSNWYRGSIDKTVIYNRVLTDTEISDRYAAGVGSLPSAPTIGTASALSTTSIRWNFSDNANDEVGFKLHDSSDTVKTSSATTDLTYLDETGLTANTQYTRHVHSYNATGDSTGSADASGYTLSVTPNVTADKTTSTWYGTTDVVFTNAAGFGSGGVQYYRYAWNQNAVYTFTDSETQWTAGTLTTTAIADGSWYLHVKAFNGDNAANGTQTYGPFYYDGSAPTGLSNTSPSNGAADQATNVTVNSSTATDSGSGSVQYYFQVALDSGFTSGVQNSGWQAGTSFAPTLAANTTYYWHVKAKDSVLNETTYTSAWSFTTSAGTPLPMSSTSSGANSAQRKTFYDGVNSKHWAFYYNGSAIEYGYSADGSAWNLGGTLPYNTADFSVTFKNIGGTGYVFIAAVSNTYDVVVRRGTMGATTIAFGSEYTVFDGTSTSDSYKRPSMATDMADNYVWVAAVKDTGLDLADHLQAYVRRSTNAGDGDLSAWQSAGSVGRKVSQLRDLVIMPQTGSNMYLLMNTDTPNIVGHAYNGTSWSSANTGGDYNWFSFPGGINSGQVNAMAVSGGDVYIGGTFTAVAGNVNASRIARWDGSTWSALGTGLNSTVYAIAVSGTDLYVGGGFTTTQGGAANAYNRIARWDTVSKTWNALVDGATNGVGNNVLAIAVSGSDIYVGGAFTTAGASTIYRIAKWNGSAWSALGSEAAATTTYVYAIAVSGNNVYAGGSFVNAGGNASADYLARWDTADSTWNAFGNSAFLTNSGSGMYVNAVAVSGSNVYVGGNFTDLGGNANTDGIARWDGSAWNNMGVGFNNCVRAITLWGGDIYAGGSFTNAGYPNIAKWSGGAWSAVGSGLNGAVYSLTLSGSDLYAGGGFTDAAGDANADRIAKWNGSTWSAVGKGFNNTVKSIAVSGSDVYAVGDFSASGSGDYGSQYFSNWGLAIAVDTDATSEVSALTSNDNVLMVYTDSADNVKFRRYNGTTGTWDATVTLRAAACSSPTISRDTATGDLYVSWIEGNTVYYKRGVFPFDSGNWDVNPTIVFGTGTNFNLTSHFNFTTGSKDILMWTNGTGAPYAVKSAVVP